MAHPYDPIGIPGPQGMPGTAIPNVYPKGAGKPGSPPTLQLKKEIIAMATMLEFIRYNQCSVPVDDVMEDALSSCIGSLYYAQTHGSTQEVRDLAAKLRNRLTALRSTHFDSRNTVGGTTSRLLSGAYAMLYGQLNAIYNEIKTIKPFLPKGSLEALVFDGALHEIGQTWSTCGVLAGDEKPEPVVL